MFTRRLVSWLTAGLLLLAFAFPAQAYVAYDTHAQFMELLTKDITRLIPRAMGSYIYQNRYDFLRGSTFMTRSIEVTPLKNKDLEEIRREAYERLMRDIPYCIEAFKGGELKFDTSHTNLSGRLGMIAYSITLLSMPAFPDLEYLERFSRVLDEVIAENQIDLWIFYDGYGDFHSCGELMERLRPADMPTFRHVRNDGYAAMMKEDNYAIFRAPNKYNKNILMTNVDMNHVYNNIINNIADAFMYIWKCSGMDLAHPSYAAPPGTIITRSSRRSVVSGGLLSRPIPPPAPPTETPEEATAPPPPGAPPGAPPGEQPPAGPEQQPPGTPQGQNIPPWIWQK